MTGNTEREWRCNYCTTVFTNRSVARLLGHLTGLAGFGIAVCKDVPRETRDTVMPRARELKNKKKSAAGSSSRSTTAAGRASSVESGQLTLEQCQERRENEEVGCVIHE